MFGLVPNILKLQQPQVSAANNVGEDSIILQLEVRFC